MNISVAVRYSWKDPVLRWTDVALFSFGSSWKVIMCVVFMRGIVAAVG